jgi:5-methylthioribose kinase
MHEITSENLADYLRSAGRAPVDGPIEVRELPGGVSNHVLRVSLPASGESFVLKQARERLRVKDEWLCPVERIWREVEVLNICHGLLKPSTGIETAVPKLLWDDRPNYCYAMTAAPESHKAWKELLLAGEIEHSRLLAVAGGRLLAQLHAGSWNNREIAIRLDDRTYFDQLRIDPYYRQVARVHNDLGPTIQRLIDSVWQHRRCFVHGDFSPKNLLVWPGHLMLIDFEVGHYGDPAFDLGFFLTHLVLKSIWSGRRQSEHLAIANDFWGEYLGTMSPAVPADEMTSLEQRMLLNLAGCLLARVDGKSQVEYLSNDQRQRVRELARQWLTKPPQTWGEMQLRTPY